MPNPITEKTLKRAAVDVKFALDDLKEAATAEAEVQAELLFSARTRLKAALALIDEKAGA